MGLIVCVHAHSIYIYTAVCLLLYQVKQEIVKMESSSPASHMSPALRKTSSAGILKPEGKIPKKGT